MPTHTLYTEKELLLRIADGDEAAFTTLFEQYRSPLFDYALRITKTVGIAEELVQDTFLKIWLYRDRLREVDHTASYLNRVMRNASIDWLRRLSLDRQLQKEIVATLPGGANTTIEDLDYGETSRLLQEAMTGLSTQQREVFLLSRQQGLSYAEIADHLNLSPNTVRNHLVKALKHLRDYLNREYGPAVAMVILFFLENR